MTDKTSHARRLRALGVTSWSLLGIIALTVVIATGLSAISGILVPLVIAVIVGSLLEPFVLWLEQRRVKPALAAVIATLVALAGTVGVIFIIAQGLLGQAPQITRQIVAGWTSMLSWVRSLDLDVVLLEQLRINVERYLPEFGRGLFGVVSGTFSGVIALAFGSFFAFFLLFFMLRDLRAFPSWLARLTKADAPLLTEMADAVKASLRGYFKGIAITALVTAPIFIVPFVLLQLPLVVPIFILYFVLSFIPYLGAWITGAFAVLIAFGSGGATAAAIVGITFLFSNGAIQSAVSSWALGSALRIHPLVVLLSTLIGGTVAGVLGMILAPPLVAAITKSIAVVRERRLTAEDVPSEVASAAAST